MTRVETYADNLERIISAEGLDNLSEKIFRAGSVSNKELEQALQFLQVKGVKWIAEFRSKDAYNRASVWTDEPMRKRSKKKIDQGLKKKINNLFTRDQIQSMGIMDMSYAQANELCQTKISKLLEGERKNA